MSATEVKVSATEVKVSATEVKVSANKSKCLLQKSKCLLQKSKQAVNLRVFRASVNPRFEGGISDFMENILMSYIEKCTGGIPS